MLEVVLSLMATNFLVLVVEAGKIVEVGDDVKLAGVSRIHGQDARLRVVSWMRSLCGLITFDGLMQFPLG